MNRPRRDPRAEWAARRIAGGTRPRFAIGLPASGRLRRDPRREAASLRVPGHGRPRFDHSRAGTPAETAPATVTAEAAPQIRIITDPACLVFAIVDAAYSRLSPHDRQIIGAARVLADATSGAVVLLAPPLQESPGAAGADRIAGLPDADDPELRAAAIAGAIASLSPRHVLFPESADGGDLARRVAALTGETLFSDAETLSPRAAIRPARAARVEQVTAPPRLLTIAPDRVPPHAGAEHEGRQIVIPEVSAQRRLAPPEDIAIDPSRLPLTEAGFVVAAGNGVSDFGSFARLGRALGATPGASRVVCDAGLMPRDRQVGASGSVLDATCYLAFGIAGAQQHLQGVARVQHVVAVNTDLHAAMIARAELAIVADAQKVMPALLAALETS
jgi:electron transfer flavoprotein alpha subunit